MTSTESPSPNEVDTARATRELLRDQVREGHLTAAGILAAVRTVQGMLRLGAVPADQLAEWRSFLGHCEAELVARQRDAERRSA